MLQIDNAPKKLQRWVYVRVCNLIAYMNASSFWSFTSRYSSIGEDLLLNPKDHPDAKIGDVVEIYQREDEGVRLLLQITSFSEDRNRAKGKF